MNKFIKTIHDISLGLFINASYGITQGDVSISNLYVMGIMTISIYLTNKGE